MSNLFETDYTGLLAAPHKVRHHFHEDGAVLIRGIVMESLRSNIIHQIDRLVGLLEIHNDINQEIVRVNADQTVSEVSNRLLNLEKKHPGSQSSIYDTICHAPVLHQFASHEAIIGMAKSVLSPDIAIHPRLIVLMSMPMGIWHLARWHQDYYYNEGPQDTLTVYAPLQKTTAHNGSL
ncbi:MAG: hypothetical protein ACI9XC_000221 [Gammaproteobacteria bacterium]|jgi:hypothetical protein